MFAPKRFSFKYIDKLCNRLSMLDASCWLLRAKRMTMTFCRQPAFCNRSRFKLMGQWTEGKNSNLSCIRWKSWSRRRIMSDFSSFPKRSMSKTSMMTKSPISRSLTIHIWPFTTITWATTLNVPDATEQSGKLWKLPKRWFLMSWTLDSHRTFNMFCQITSDFWHYKLGVKRMKRNWRSCKLMKLLKELQSSFTW